MELMHENAAPFLLPGDGHAVLLTHGFTGSAAHMRPLGEYLNRQGFTVRGILLPGHGTSLADMARRSWREWLQTELTAVEELKKEYRFVSVAGLSMGGDLSLIAAERLEVTACVAISAPMKTKAGFTWAAPVLALFKPEILWQNGAVGRDDLMHDYNIGYPGVPTARIADLRRLMRLAKHNLPSVTCPLLAVQSHADETVSADSAQIIYDKAGAGVKQLLWLENVPHVCTISSEMEHIGREMTSFLRQAESR